MNFKLSMNNSSISFKSFSVTNNRLSVSPLYEAPINFSRGSQMHRLAFRRNFSTNFYHCNMFVKRTILLCPSKHPIIISRNMFKASENLPAARGVTNSAYNALTRSNHTPYVHRPANIRSYACVHGGDWKNPKPKPPVKDTDLSGKHKLITETNCSYIDCKKINCADPKDPTAFICPRSPHLNETSIPPTNQGFTTWLIGNTTTQEPPHIPGRQIDPNVNYSGQNKQQRMVEESNPPVINSKDLNVDPKISKYLQDHHNEITK